jgi:dTDP-4-amino-4,6-dideoxygalactose transaminase
VGKPLGAFPHTDRATTEVLSLPMHTELTEEQQRYIAEAVLEAVGS